MVFSLIYYYAEYRFSVGQPAYVPARLLGKGTALNAMHWMETAPDITDASVEVIRLLLFYASERDSKYLEAAITVAATTLHRTQSSILRNLETNVV